MKNLIIFGPPGSGKGTQCENLIKKFGLKHLSTGNILRAEIQKESDLGLEVKNIMAKGELVSDSIVNKLILDFIKMNQNSTGFLFDGYPRTLIQAESLSQILAQFNIVINKVISLLVNQDELVKRLLVRGVNSGRVDDDKKIILARLQEFDKKTIQVGNFYKEKGIFIEISGEGSVDEVFKRILINL